MFFSFALICRYRRRLENKSRFCPKRISGFRGGIGGDATTASTLEMNRLSLKENDELAKARVAISYRSF